MAGVMQSGRCGALDLPSDRIDAAIAALATRQYGVVGRAQLVALGAGRGAIRHRLETKRLHAVHRTVYAVGHPLLPRHGRYMAAVLACGREAVLSHRSAAALWGLLEDGSAMTDVTTPRRGARRINGVRVHRSRRLERDDIATCERIPVTTPARTLVDIATVLSARRVRRAVETSLMMGVFDLAAVDRALAGAPGVRGTGTLRALLGEVADEPPFTRTELERRFLELVRRAHLPLPVVNGLVEGHEVDFHWPAQRFVVETDGGAAHRHRLAFHQDRRRDLDLELAGWHVIRITWRQVVEEPERVATLLRRRLDE